MILRVRTDRGVPPQPEQVVIFLYNFIYAVSGCSYAEDTHTWEQLHFSARPPPTTVVLGGRVGGEHIIESSLQTSFTAQQHHRRYDGGDDGGGRLDEIKQLQKVSRVGTPTVRTAKC